MIIQNIITVVSKHSIKFILILLGFIAGCQNNSYQSGQNKKTYLTRRENQSLPGKKETGCKTFLQFVEKHKLNIDAESLVQCYSMDSIDTHKNIKFYVLKYETRRHTNDKSDPVSVRLIVVKAGKVVNVFKTGVVYPEDFDFETQINNRWFFFEEWSSPAGISTQILYDARQNKFYRAEKIPEYKKIEFDKFNPENKQLPVILSDGTTKIINFN